MAAAIETVIDHLKAEDRMVANYLWFKHGDADNAEPANLFVRPLLNPS